MPLVPVLQAADLVAERPPGTSDDIHFTEALAEAVIRRSTEPGDVILDPFAGYGTTLAVAARLGRRAIGVELLGEHVEIARARLREADTRLIHGDARQLAALVREPVDLVLTSPPYMAGSNHPENPLTGYRTEDGDYATYLRDLGSIFEQAVGLLRPGGHLVVNVANVVGLDGRTTPLAADLAPVIEEHVPLLGALTLEWDEAPSGLDGDYLLWFQKPRSDPETGEVYGVAVRLAHEPA
jgi:DNA modification methylase